MTMGRRLDLDWLRIGAFALLILYHIGMVFVPWEFHIKTDDPQQWSVAPMLLLNAWRLALLFLVSGVASRFLLRKRRGGFAGDRLRRLFIPLVAGMVLWIAPQGWVDVRVNHGYPHGFGWFSTHDWFRFDGALGIDLPTWNQLWFVVYLLAYSLLLAGLAALPGGWRAGAQDVFDRVFGGWRVVALPMLAFIFARLVLYPRFEETHAFAGDWAAHFLYGFSFAFGVGLAGTRRLWGDIARFWPWCAGAALLAGVPTAWVNVTLGENEQASDATLTIIRICRGIQGWGAIVALLGFAQAFLQRDHPWRPWLNRAVFPAYIAHQTVILVVMYWLKPLGLGAGAEFALLVAATVAGSWLFAAIGMRAGWLAPLFGVERQSAPSWASSQRLRGRPPA